MYDEPAAGPDTGVIFLHLPKTAGSTINAILARQYPRRQRYVINPVRAGHSEDRFRKLPEDRRARVRLLRGHFMYGMHRWMPRQCVYFTFLRSPVARAMSVYRYISQNPVHPRHALGKGLSPEEFLADDRLHPANVQTRAIAGPRVADEDLLDTAKANLDAHFAVAGLAERFDESLLLLQDALGWKDIRYRPRNTSRKAPDGARAPTGPSAEVKALVARRETLDVELYDWVAGRFDAHVAGLGESFGARLRDFQTVNASNTAFHDRFEPIVQRGEAVARRVMFQLRRLGP